MGRPVLFEATIGALTKRLSNEAFSGANYWHPAIANFGDLELMPEAESGFISSRFSTLVVHNLPFDSNSLFNYPNATYPITHQPYACALYFGEGTTPLFEGTFIVRDVDQTTITLELNKNNAYDTDYLLRIPDEDGAKLEKIENDAGVVKITTDSPNSFTDADGVLFTEITVTGSNFANIPDFNYDPDEDNLHTIAAKLVTAGSDQFTLSGQDPVAVDLPLSGDYIDGSGGVKNGGAVADTLTNGYVGKSTLRSHCFGDVEHVIPQKLSPTVLSSPHLRVSGKIVRLYEDGVMIGASTNATTITTVTVNQTVAGDPATKYTKTGHTFRAGDILIGSSFTPTSPVNLNVGDQTVVLVDGDSFYTDLDSSGGGGPYTGGSLNFHPTFSTAPTAALITLNAATTGRLSVSGRGIDGNSIADFFQYIATVFGLSLNRDKVPAATSTIAFTQAEQTQAIDLAGKLARAINYQFYIEDGTLYLIDKILEPDAFAFITDENGDYITDDNDVFLVTGEYAWSFEVAEIQATDIEYPVPTQQIEMNFIQRQAGYQDNGGSPVPVLVEKNRHEFVRSATFAVGNRTRVDCYADASHRFYLRKAIMEDLLEIGNRPVATLTVHGINTDIKPGDQVDYYDEDLGCDVTLFVRGIRYHLMDLRTSFTGDCSLSSRIQL